MSYQLVDIVLTNVGGRDPTAKLIAAWLARRADGDGLCWPSIQDMAENCCVSRRAVQRAVERLELSGVLERERNVGRSRTNRYRLQLEVLGGGVVLPAPSDACKTIEAQRRKRASIRHPFGSVCVTASEPRAQPEKVNVVHPRGERRTPRKGERGTPEAVSSEAVSEAVRIPPSGGASRSAFGGTTAQGRGGGSSEQSRTSTAGNDSVWRAIGLPGPVGTSVFRATFEAQCAENFKLDPRRVGRWMVQRLEALGAGECVPDAFRQAVGTVQPPGGGNP